MSSVIVGLTGGIASGKSEVSRRFEALGIAVRRVQWSAFAVAGALAGLAGGLYAFSKGSVAPDALAVARSVDGLAMVLLGGLQQLAGPVVGAAAFTWLHDSLARGTEYWRALLGGVILLLVLLFPQGISGLGHYWKALAALYLVALTRRLLRGQSPHYAVFQGFERIGAGCRIRHRAGRADQLHRHRFPSGAKLWRHARADIVLGLGAGHGRGSVLLAAQHVVAQTGGGGMVHARRGGVGHRRGYRRIHDERGDWCFCRQRSAHHLGGGDRLV